MSDLNPPDLSHQRSQAEEEGLEVSQNAFTFVPGCLPAPLMSLPSLTPLPVPQTSCWLARGEADLASC